MSTEPRHVERPTETDLERARLVVRDHLTPTPVIALNTGKHDWLKLESLQPTGSFKVRGALVSTAALPEGSRIITASAGNHALGVAYASEKLGVPATIVVATTASPKKVGLLRTKPINLVEHGIGYDAAEQHALEMAANDPSSTFVSAYNDPQIIAATATIVDEIVGQVPGDEPLRLVVPASGGGLLAGIALRASQLSAGSRRIEVIGVEAAESPAMSAALLVGEVVQVAVGETIADGLSGNIEPGAVTIPIIGESVTTVVAVSESQIREAIRDLVHGYGLIAEGAGAAAYAAIRSGLLPAFHGQTIGILSGRNIAATVLHEVLAENS